METTVSVKKKGISGSTLKIIAITAMLIDHIGAVIFERVLTNQGLLNYNNMSMEEMFQFISANGILLFTYFIMRMVIGRLGFPIFCFLLVEGFEHTRNVTKYAARLLAFAFISEIPFDLAFAGKPFYWNYQNVFFTLFLGLMVMIAYQTIDKLRLNMFFNIVLKAIALIALAYAAQLLKTDYAAIGVLCIAVLYIFRRNKTYQIIAGCCAFIWEVTAPLAFIPIGFYNKTRGMNIKYFFYAFYPIHLLILYGIARLCKLI